jgi:hypothetical protein
MPLGAARPYANAAHQARFSVRKFMPETSYSRRYHVREAGRGLLRFTISRPFFRQIVQQSWFLSGVPLTPSPTFIQEPAIPQP